MLPSRCSESGPYISGVQTPSGERHPTCAVASEEEPVELGSDLGGCAPWRVLRLRGKALNEATGWNQLLLLSYCEVSTEMNSKQNTKKEVPPPLTR